MAPFSSEHSKLMLTLPAHVERNINSSVPVAGIFMDSAINGPSNFTTGVQVGLTLIGILAGIVTSVVLYYIYQAVLRMVKKGLGKKGRKMEEMVKGNQVESQRLEQTRALHQLSNQECEVQEGQVSIADGVVMPKNFPSQGKLRRTQASLNCPTSDDVLRAAGAIGYEYISQEERELERAKTLMILTGGY